MGYFHAYELPERDRCNNFGPFSRSELYERSYVSQNLCGPGERGIFWSSFYFLLLQEDYRSALLSLSLESHSMFLRLRLRCRIRLDACSPRGATSRVAGQSDHRIVLLLRCRYKTLHIQNN